MARTDTRKARDGNPYVPDQGLGEPDAAPPGRASASEAKRETHGEDHCRQVADLALRAQQLRIAAELDALAARQEHDTSLGFDQYQLSAMTWAVRDAAQRVRDDRWGAAS